LRPLRDGANLARLFLLPFAVAKEVEHVQAPTAGQALRMQWALALMILTFCPLRVTSLCQLRIDRHFVWSRSGSKGELRLQFEWGELKGDLPEVLPLPAECARLVRIYMERFRPALASRSSPYLFPGRTATRAKLRSVLSSQLQTLIYKRTGFEVNPHLYRHLVHLVVLTRFPGAYAMISRVLTHRSLETARKNYAYFDVELSLNAYQRLIWDVQEGRSIKATPAQVAYEIDREDMRDRIR
jgi:integrase